MVTRTPPQLQEKSSLLGPLSASVAWYARRGRGSDRLSDNRPSINSLAKLHCACLQRLRSGCPQNNIEARWFSARSRHSFIGQVRRADSSGDRVRMPGHVRSGPRPRRRAATQIDLQTVRRPVRAGTPEVRDQLRCQLPRRLLAVPRQPLEALAAGRLVPVEPATGKLRTKPGKAAR